jgi:hypothetical protein
VRLAEVLGDKTLFTVGSLAPRHRLPPLVAGASVAAAATPVAERKANGADIDASTPVTIAADAFPLTD